MQAAKQGAVALRSAGRGSFALALGVLGFLPRHCQFPPHGGGGSGGTGTGGSSAGTTQVGGSAGDGTSAGASTTGGEGGNTGAGTAGEGGGGPVPDDRVSEPLLGCSNAASGKATPGLFQILPPAPSDTPEESQGWLTDWSGDGRSAVGYYETPVVDGAYGVITLKWSADRGYEVVSKVAIDVAGFQEPPTALSSCDGSVLALRLGEGSVYVDGADIPPVEMKIDFFHDDLRLAEDGSSITFLTGIRDQTRPSSEWHSTKGDVRSLLLESIQSLSADGLTTFGTSFCFIEGCTYPTYFRWRPLLDGSLPDVSIGTPTPIVAADGESVVYSDGQEHLQIWRPDASESVDCGGPCQAVAWSARARVLLVATDSGMSLWTRVHGFRPLESLLTLPTGWSIHPDTISLDGWTVSGTATNDGGDQPYFRATLNADAYR